ncbi:hypothetical protein HZB00_03105 [Candidatus Woesearchaeota archaeon]|nr:hypothetical protein [Candidatus Woesearchaeota archaeon]
MISRRSLRALLLGSALSLGCGASPSLDITVLAADSAPQQRETPRPATFPEDSAQGLLHYGLVMRFHKADDTVWSAGISFDHQNILPEINLTVADAVDLVGKANNSAYDFVEVDQSEFTAHYLGKEDLPASIELQNAATTAYDPHFSQIVEFIASPVEVNGGFFGKRYAFGRFPVNGDVHGDNAYLYLAVLGEDPTGRWLGEFVYKDIPDSVKSEHYRTFIHETWNLFKGVK